MPKVMHSSEVNDCGSNEGQLIASFHRSDSPFKQQTRAIVCLDFGLLPALKSLADLCPRDPCRLILRIRDQTPLHSSTGLQPAKRVTTNPCSRARSTFAEVTRWTYENENTLVRTSWLPTPATSAFVSLEFCVTPVPTCRQLIRWSSRALVSSQSVRGCRRSSTNFLRRFQK